MTASARISIVLTLLAWGVSCRQVVGIDDRSFHAGGPLVCGLPTLGATPACAPCMMQACCDESHYCADVSGCPNLSVCMQACPSGDSPCREKCAALTPDRAANAALESVQACRVTECAMECTGGPWACVGQVEWNFPSFVLAQLPITATLVQASDGGVIGVPNVMGRVCSIADPMCTNPFATAMSDPSSGVVTLKVDVRMHPPPLSVFVEYRADGFLDTLVSLNTPPVSGTVDLGSLAMESAASVALAATTNLHATYDPTRAIVAVLPYDCTGRPASLIAQVDFPDADAQTKTLQPYPVTGEAVAMNLPVNAPALLARVAARVWGKTRIVGTASVVVRPNAKTLVYLNPTP